MCLSLFRKTVTCCCVTRKHTNCVCICHRKSQTCNAMEEIVCGGLIDDPHACVIFSANLLRDSCRDDVEELGRRRGEGGGAAAKVLLYYICVRSARTNEEAFDKQQGRAPKRRRKRENLRHGAIGEMECENGREKDECVCYICVCVVDDLLVFLFWVVRHAEELMIHHFFFGNGSCSTNGECCKNS